MFEEKFISLCETAAEKLSAEAVSMQAERNGIHCLIKFDNVSILITFAKKVSQIKNVLYCVVFPGKNNTTIYYHLPEVFAALGIHEYRSCYFPEIESEKRMDVCFDNLLNIIETHLPCIDQKSSEGGLPTSCDLKRITTLEEAMIFEKGSQRSREFLTVYTYTEKKPYKLLLNGETEKAISCYEELKNKGKLTEYEKMLLKFLQSNDSMYFEFMPKECLTSEVVSQRRKQLGAAYAKSFILLYIIFSLVFLLGEFIFYKLFTANCIAYFGASYQIPFLISVLPSFFCAIAFRKKLFKIISPKKYEDLTEKDSFENGKGFDILSRIAAFIFSAGTIAITIIIFACTVRVYSDRFDVMGENGILSREIFLYQEIEDFYHINARYNENGKRVDRSSYVVKMKDGRTFDFNGSAFEREIENELLPLTKQYHGNVIYVDTEKDIPK